METKLHTSKGAALLVFVIFFMVTSLTLVLVLGNSVYDDLVSYRVLQHGKQSLYGAEAAIEDAIYRHRDGRNYSSSESFTFAGITINTTRTNDVDSYRIVAETSDENAIRTSQTLLYLGDGVSFNFGMQSGTGGIVMTNSASVRGNVFSNGTIAGAGSSMVYGDIIATGASGLVTGVHATGSVWAHTINSSIIDKDAHYMSITGSTVGGVSYPGSADQAAVPLPITDAQIADWQNGILTTGTKIASTSTECSSGTYIINTDTTLNNVLIECNVQMKKQGASTVITIAGPVWIQGNLDFNSGPDIVASSSLGRKSVQIIVDKPTDRINSSKISVNQSTNFSSGTSSSYTMLVSMNNSSESGGTVKAINVAQSANGKVLMYAGHGLVDLGNSIVLKEVTADKITIGNSAQVVYESGLASLLFTAGPSGGYTISGWREIE